MAGRIPPREDRRVIAIQMLPKAYTEIQRLKGEATWSKFIIECVIAKVGNNDILTAELASLPEPKQPKPKAEKKVKKAKVTGEEPTEVELKTIEEEQPNKPESEPKPEPTEPKIEPTKPEVKVAAKSKKATFGKPGKVAAQK